MRACSEDAVSCADPRAGPAPAPVDIATLDAPDALRAALDAAGWRVDALARALPRLHALPGLFDPRERCAWLGGFRRAYPRLGGLPPAAREALLALLQAWCDWPLYLALRDLPLRDLDLQGAALHDPARPDAVDRDADIEAGHRDAVDALLRCGRLDEAEDRCRRRLLARPRDEAAAALHAHLQRWRCFVAERAPPIVDDLLRLEPLGHHHCDDFAWQYWDAEIARRCCLPTFRDAEDWHRWLDECWRWGDQRLYAVVHRDWGFVGSVSLVVHGDIGFFYYWIGRDFQGNGLGPAAVRLLLGDAFERRGLRACYAKVFEDNRPSRRAMEGIGFELLDFQPAPPHDDERFYRLGAPLPRERCVAELRTLFDRMHSETRIAVPCAAADVF